MADDGGEITREPSGPVPPEAVSSPTLLIQQAPDIETSGAVLLRQIIVRDTGAESQIASEPAEGAVELGVAPSGIDDLQCDVPELGVCTAPGTAWHGLA